MSFRKALAAMAVLAVLSSCSGGRSVKPLAEPSAPAALKPAPLAESFSLPEIPAEQAPKETIANTTEAQKTDSKPSLLEGVLVEEGDEQYIILNFENSDIQTIIATFGELLNMNYILTPGISGNITIQSYDKFPMRNLFEIFQNILSINGLTAVKQGDFYTIVPIDTAKNFPLEIGIGKGPEMPLDSTFVTQLIPVENIKVADLANILRNIVPRGANLIVYEPANMLIVTARPPTLEKFIKVIEVLDVPDSDSQAIKTFVYYVENGEAKKLESILKTTYPEKIETSSKTAAPAPVVARRSAPTPTPASVGESLPGELGQVTISAYEDINALIIKCTPRSYISLLEVLKKIDIPPKQVLIEVIIAEVSLTNSMEYGLEWMLRKNNGNYAGMNPVRFLTSDNTTGIKAPADVSIPSGELTTIGGGSMNDGEYVYFFSAIAKDSDLDIMASPHILAVDNKEAEIKIGKEVPTATSTTQSNEAVTTSSQIQYKTVGTILKVTPHITEKGNVSMKIEVESSDLGADTKIGTGAYPSFITRKTTTNAIVKDGHTLFLGGLISDKKTNSASGIPFLSRIPVLGYLFSSELWSKDKTEMFVMVTPRVIHNHDDADRFSAQFEKKVKNIRTNLQKVNKKKSEDESDTHGQAPASPEPGKSKASESATSK